RLTAVGEAGRQIHFSEVPHAEAHRILDQFRKLLGGDAPPPLKAPAVPRLAPPRDPLAKKELLAPFGTQDRAALPPPGAGARFSPDQRGRLRGFLAPPSDQAAVAAIQALFKDPDSIDTRRRLARDTQRSRETRVAAIQSLMHEDSADLTDFLIGMAADPVVDL